MVHIHIERNLMLPGFTNQLIAVNNVSVCACPVAPGDGTGVGLWLIPYNILLRFRISCLSQIRKGIRKGNVLPRAGFSIVMLSQDLKII